MTCAAGKIAHRRHPGLEIADVFREHAHHLGPLSGQKRKVVQAILSCRTAVRGGHRQTCDLCGYEGVFYNSCRNRHCPKCQTLSQARWVEARKQDLLPVEYFHVVFTLPDVLHPLFLGNPKVGFKLLFSAVRETLLEVALNPAHLGARIGFTAVLHTWTQTLAYHPHIHCIVPGGGLNPEGTQWVPSKAKFFLPVRILSTVFRGKLLSKLEAVLAKGSVHSSAPNPKVLLIQAARKKWHVYSKPPFSKADQVLEYLGRYTHRIAISNHRLISMRNGQIAFQWRDRADGNKTKLLTLKATEFLRRFLLHVLPSRLVRIRHFGFLANSVRRKKLTRCQELLQVPRQEINADDNKSETWQETLLRLTGKDVTRCPQCKRGRLILEELAPIPAVLLAWRFPVASPGSSPFELPGRAFSP